MKLPRIGRKLGAMLIMALATALCGIFLKADKLPSVTITFASLYGIFCGAHAYTDARLTPPATPAPSKEEAS